MCQERKPHKHAEWIKAWADGAEIQFSYDGFKWCSIECPSFHDEVKYRIKPKDKEPIVRYARVLYTDYDPDDAYEDQCNIRATWTYWGKEPPCYDGIKATFCPDTGKLLSVEMI